MTQPPAARRRGVEGGCKDCGGRFFSGRGACARCLTSHGVLPKGRWFCKNALVRPAGCVLHLPKRWKCCACTSAPWKGAHEKGHASARDKMMIRRNCSYETRCVCRRCLSSMWVLGWQPGKRLCVLRQEGLNNQTDAACPLTACFVWDRQCQGTSHVQGREQRWCAALGRRPIQERAVKGQQQHHCHCTRHQARTNTQS